ncbi:hypothetical protein CcrC1_gp169 [Caulobacter phage C1]|nr:hypothetical protein CcrC1_gp169 [Caulobacter phage C1]UTU08398.1 hypothetical protein CcrC2_gp170 [Caulobacter phage C2]UTU08915.1 hypothetical protein CcrJ4_gp164 [Caulobacter phage J4]UTU09471.1 hypothetical protein CcrBL47_gp185 [Caulobacter phage BL47]UTU10031.1 hypothetical protein CcrRB23_gp169 [Caulobacter phage RB23]WGN97066.1 hypothetical protein [Bertelyvirus sp.]
MPPKRRLSEQSVSRVRRAIFAFFLTLLSWASIMTLARFPVPVNQEIVMKAIDSLGFFATAIGLGYIGGSVVDFSGMFSAIGGKFGINIPQAMPPQQRNDEIGGV